MKIVSILYTAVSVPGRPGVEKRGTEGGEEVLERRGVSSRVLRPTRTSSAGASADHIGDLTVDGENVHVVQGDDDRIEDARSPGVVIEGFGASLGKDELFEDRDDPGEELGHRLEPEEDTDHSGYFEDAETLDYLGDVLTGRTDQ
ncbi:hypothetical protein ACFW4K_05210 [Nocardiopsis alba]|uniref:hypothetical protein n=1 Tax=Nocardiopsis alba TaxID=53437 RepID=UPI0036721259